MIFPFFIINFSFCAIINVPEDQPTIQSGINTSIDGDTVLVQPGTYVENINFNGHNIVLGSMFILTGNTSYISQTIIDGNQSGSVVSFESGEDSSAVLNGFVITNGSGHWVDGYCGGGIYIESSNPTLKFLQVTGNSVTLIGFVWPLGGGICLWYDANPTINNIVLSNNYSYEGAGIFIMAGYNSGCTSKLNNLTIVNNYSEWYGGCISGYETDEEFIFQNSVCWENYAGITGEEIDGEIAVEYSNIQSGYNGIGNIDTDPLFVDPENGDYHLQPGSPCIDAGDPDSPLDPDGTIADMGAFYFNQDCPLNGDVSGDNLVDVLDIVMVIDCIINETGECSCADLNFDGTVDVSDIVLIVEIILGG